MALSIGLPYLTVLLSTPLAAEAERLRDPIDATDGYVCREGQGQTGQSYKDLAVDSVACRAACNVDQHCMGFDCSDEQPSCRLYGANIPMIGNGSTNDRQYCVRFEFNLLDAEAVPGDGRFEPTLEWAKSKLEVPVVEFNYKRLSGGLLTGATGAGFFTCNVKYGGSIAQPSFGLPEKIFVKVRSPHQPLDAFKSENAVSALVKSLPRPPAIARALSYDQNYMIMENIGVPIEGSHQFSESEKFAFLDAFAELHATFWGLAEARGLQDLPGWGRAATQGPLAADHFASLIDWYQVPEPARGLVKRAYTEIGPARMLKLMNEFGVTLIHGDAHRGQMLHLYDDSSAKTGDRTIGLIDFGSAVLASPAIDIGYLIPEFGIAEHEKFIQYYYRLLVNRTGCLNRDSPNDQNLPLCSAEQFVKLCRMGAFIRGTFAMVLLLGQLGEAVGQALANPDYLKQNPNPSFDAVASFFESFDQDTFKFLADNTKDVDLCNDFIDCASVVRQAGCSATWRTMCPGTHHPAGEQFDDIPVAVGCPAECKDCSALLNVSVNPSRTQQSVIDSLAARGLPSARSSQPLRSDFAVDP
eukprot:TRINITY_DN29885_c0_g1_i1.p1 TRINITY_DN29885_c0_g1~~TRINITY_DN29885_c0_g1_i1.p1  ORF type:complete len:583 (+),score=47.37 TRINITY_DN29885_c0_g1_i1:68-1816(+)